MSDLAAAAAALGVPEAIVQRSAAARAADTGMSVDEVLAAWAGGGAAFVAAAPGAPLTVEAAGDAPQSEEAAEPGPPVPVIEIPPTTAIPAPAPAATAVPGKPPVLVGSVDKPLGVFFGAVGLFLAVFLVSLVGPALPVDEPGARTSELPYSEPAQQGQLIYESVGCGSCHTQMVRPVVSDVGLGAVTLSDSNQLLGTRRFGPDLSDVGSRLTGSQIESVILGSGDHPALSLSASDLESLVAYLVESKTAAAAPATAGATSGQATD